MSVFEVEVKSNLWLSLGSLDNLFFCSGEKNNKKQVLDTKQNKSELVVKKIKIHKTHV